jgi:hypothetical protein
MACSQTLCGLTSDCSASMGGIKRVWIADYKEGAATTIADGKITAFSGDTDWKEYYIRKNTGSMTSTLNVDPANGVNYVSTELSLVFTKQETVKRIEMSALVLSDVMCVVEDANSTKWFLGKDGPCISTAAGAETGVNKQDGNKYTLTITSEDITFPLEVTASME